MSRLRMMRNGMGHWATLVAASGLGLSVAGCGAVYPELATPTRLAPPGFTFEPAPPADLVYLAFGKATIPDKTRDGRQWDETGGSLPDPFAKLIVDGKDLIVTPVAENTLNPVWPNQKRGNYRLAPDAKVRVELWDSNPISNHPICKETVRDLHEQISSQQPVEIPCESGAYIQLVAEPAHGKIGIGIRYEIRTDEVYVVRILTESPAARAGIAPGEQITRIMGEPASGMPEGRVRSLMNSNGPTGLKLTLASKGKPSRDVELKDGPIYSLLSEETP